MICTHLDSEYTKHYNFRIENAYVTLLVELMSSGILTNACCSDQFQLVYAKSKTAPEYQHTTGTVMDLWRESTGGAANGHLVSATHLKERVLEFKVIVDYPRKQASYFCSEFWLPPTRAAMFSMIFIRICRMILIIKLLLVSDMDLESQTQCPWLHPKVVNESSQQLWHQPPSVGIICINLWICN